MSDNPRKPLGGKCYGSIAHLPGSRLGPGDHHCHEGQGTICTVKARDKHDRVIVQEKLDGSNVGVYRVNGDIVPLMRAGYLANTSPYPQHHLWWDWAHANKSRFLELLDDGERVCGEWLAQAHGTRYRVSCIFEPFAAFDLMRGGVRANFDDFTERICSMTTPFNTPKFLGFGPMAIAEAMRLQEPSSPFRLDSAEGAVWRVERKGVVDFLAKYVKPDKQDGIFLPEVSGKDAVWNWRPKGEASS